MSDLTNLSASELAAGIRRGAYSSRKVVAAHPERIAHINSLLNAVVQLNPRALDEALRARLRVPGVTRPIPDGGA